MNRENFRKKIDQLWKQLTTTVDQINRSDNDIVIRAEEILMETDTAIRQLKDILKQYQFSDWSDEIFFFKKTIRSSVFVMTFKSSLLNADRIASSEIGSMRFCSSVRGL